MRLYELTAQWRALADAAIDAADSAEGEIPFDLIAAMSVIDGQVDDKLAGCCRVLKEIEAARDAFKKESLRLSARATSCDNHSESLKKYMKDQMELCGWDKRKVDDLFTVAIQKNSMPSVELLDLDAIPHSWDKPQERQVDVTGIRDALKAGISVPGAELKFGTHLRVR